MKQVLVEFAAKTHVPATRKFFLVVFNVKISKVISSGRGVSLQVPHSDARFVYDIVAITSFGTPFCGRENPAVDVKVFQYLDCIENMFSQKRRIQQNYGLAHNIFQLEF